jgi:hypothetical protein
MKTIEYLVGGLEHECYFSIQLGMSSSQVTNSIIFQGGRRKTTNQILQVGPSIDAIDESCHVRQGEVITSWLLSSLHPTESWEPRQFSIGSGKVHVDQFLASVMVMFGDVALSRKGDF